jgi:hypothetical protein
MRLVLSPFSHGPLVIGGGFGWKLDGTFFQAHQSRAAEKLPKSRNLPPSLDGAVASHRSDPECVVSWTLGFFKRDGLRRFPGWKLESPSSSPGSIEYSVSCARGLWLCEAPTPTRQKAARGRHSILYLATCPSAR